MYILMIIAKMIMIFIKFLLKVQLISITIFCLFNVFSIGKSSPKLVCIFAYL